MCKAPTEQVCFRCKTPLCPEHLPDPSARCDSCEREYRSWPSREPRVLAIGSLLAAAWIAGTLGMLEVVPMLAVIWALTFPAAVTAVATRRLHSARAIFLRQEKRPRAIADKRQLKLGP